MTTLKMDSLWKTHNIQFNKQDCFFVYFFLFFFFRKADWQRKPVVLIKQIVLWKKINENVIIVAATLICTPFFFCYVFMEWNN